ncbi:MAG: hypothetical protein MMC23_008952 [Stictis urceolatum]|nr:hypothetical protein [Stictis urceolata]
MTQLLDIRLGPGAVVLPPKIKRIHLDFASKINDGHFGARKVWRTYLPRLKYHNPTVSMTVNRSTDQAGPATMTIIFAQPGHPTTSTADLSGSNERIETIDMKHKHESDILRSLMEITGAEDTKATAEEELDLRQLAEDRIRSEQDRVRSRLDLESRRREAQLLEQARGMSSGDNTVV